MNYCIINGKKSTLIKGLLIQSLPPVSRPLMRTRIEEIDGRDGDIVTKLGYSAYDKEMSIGLFGDFDIDEVISFFDTEGTVIFSNEPDKFYKFQMLNQIDFERLASFRTALVTFHVQPFKYSAVDDYLAFVANKLVVNTYSATKNGITVIAQNGSLTIQGTGTSETEFYIPIDAMPLEAGTYTLKAITDGTGESACSMRVVGTIATDADSFGSSALALEDEGSATLSDTFTESKTFHFLWLHCESGTALNFTLEAQMLNDLDSFQIINRGNTFSRPKMTIYGSGTLVLSINGSQLFIISLANAGYITIDGASMEAYKGNTLMNRSVVGDYNNLRLKTGKNTISWAGSVGRIEIEKYSRWI